MPEIVGAAGARSRPSSPPPPSPPSPPSGGDDDARPSLAQVLIGVMAGLLLCSCAVARVATIVLFDGDTERVEESSSAEHAPPDECAPPPALTVGSGRDPVLTPLSPCQVERVNSCGYTAPGDPEPLAISQLGEQWSGGGLGAREERCAATEAGPRTTWTLGASSPGRCPGVTLTLECP